MVHYHVVVNMPGYLPESDPVCFTVQDDAENYAEDLEEELREAGDDEYVVDIIEVPADECEE